MRKTMREIQDAKREQALADIREQVGQGRLTIRQMSVDERARHARAASDTRPARRPR